MSASVALTISCSLPNSPSSLFHRFHNLKPTLFASLKQPLQRDLQNFPVRVDVSETVKNASLKLLDALVDSVFRFVDQPLLPSQSNFAPVAELKKAVVVTDIEGKIPDEFCEGVYIRNGANPMFGGLKSVESIFGKSNEIWVDGEGMLHALYFQQSTSTDGNESCWTIYYNNSYVETRTYNVQKQRNKPSFLPTVEGPPLSVLSAYLLNTLRLGEANKHLSNTNVFGHGGKVYSNTENHIPQEIDVFTLQTLGYWDVNGSWTRPFTSHPKRAPSTGELVIVGFDAIKPYLELGVISADGKSLIHRVDLKLSRCSYIHEIGVTQRYNVILDFPLTIDLHRVIRGGSLIKYNKQEYARIGVMPRYGDAGSVQWFDVEPNCTFHILNCFEDDTGEVVVWGCRARESILPGPEMGINKFDWFSTRFQDHFGALFSRCYEWRLNLRTGEVKENYLSGTQFSMDFPIINPHFTGLKNKFGYAQILDSHASSVSGMTKYGGLAKLYFEEQNQESNLENGKLVKEEYHKFEKNTFCTGAAFIPKMGNNVDEDDGWIITYVHNEDTNVSKAYIIDTKNFSGQPVAKITLPCRIPYGFHGAFMPLAFS